MKSYVRIIIQGAAIAALLLLSGCKLFETKEDPPSERELYTAAVSKAFADAAARPLFKLECPDAGCIVKSLEVGNPLAIMELSKAVQVALAPPVPVPPWWAQPLNTVLSAIVQVGSIKYGLAGVGNIVSSVVGGMATVSNAGFGALTQQGGQAFAAYDRTMQAGWTAMTQRPPATPTVTNTYTWDVSGSGNNFGSGTVSYSNAPISNSYNPVNPAARVCFPNAAGQMICS